MVQFRDLLNDENDRKIREVVFIGGETIHVYEPSKKNIEEIIDLQDRFISGENKTNIKIGETDLLRIFFPMLTDVTGMEDLSDEEVGRVAENPSLAYIQASHVMEGIITEVYKTVILQARNKVMDVDFQLESLTHQNELIERTLGLASKNKTTSGAAKKVSDAHKKVIEAQNKVDMTTIDKNGITLKDGSFNLEDSVSNAAPVAKHSTILEKYKADFGE